MTIFEADWVCPVSSPPVRNGRLAVENGRICPLLSEENRREKTGGNSYDRVTFPGCAIIPGFVNGHSHLELTILRGFLDDLPFTEWIPHLTRLKYEQLSRNDMLISANLGCIEMLRAGVTCLGEVMDLGTAWEAMRSFGLQGIVYQEVFGPSESHADESLAALKRKIDAYWREQTPSFRAGVSPHAPYTVSQKLFRAVNDYSRAEGLPLTVHIGESKDEGAFVRHGTGLFADRLRARGITVSGAGCSPVAYLDRCGLLRPEVLLIHAIDLEDQDLTLLRDKGAGVVHCPKSNAKLAHPTARVAEMKAAGVRLSLGTDSMASNNAVDMFEEMRAAIFQQRSFTGRFDALDAPTAFRMATLGGAECLGLSSELGSLDPGKRADFAVVNLDDVSLQPVHDPIESLVYSASRHNVKATYLGGREVAIDAADVIAECDRIAAKLRK